jgi:uncharacterized membrane protein YdbT with pleckstrin-like domain
MTKDKKQFKGQYDDEEVLLVFRKHPVVMRKGLILASLGLLVGPMYVFAISYLSPDNIPSEVQYLLILAAGFVLFALLMFPSWIYWYFSVYIMTNQRFIQTTQKGFFHRSVSDIGIKHIQSVNYQVAGMQETVLGFGSVLIQTYLGDILINNVHHPEQIMNDLFGVLREYGDVSDPSVDEQTTPKITRP